MDLIIFLRVPDSVPIPDNSFIISEWLDLFLTCRLMCAECCQSVAVYDRVL
jgi:hypothetical protein